MWGVMTVVFFLFNVLRGDPARMMLGQREDAQQLENIRAKYGFDRSLSAQYFLYLNDVSLLSFHHSNLDAYTHIGKYQAYPIFNIGSYQIALKFPFLRTSFKKTGKSVVTIIGDTLPNTVVLAISSILIAIVIGVFVGLLAAVCKDSWFDRFALFFGILGMSVPSFFSEVPPAKPATLELSFNGGRILSNT